MTHELLKPILAGVRAEARKVRCTVFDDTRPIFLQLAEQLANDILRGTYQEGDQVPSTNELATFHRINPATAGKSVNLLVDEGVLVKRRGIGMFVADGAIALITASRRQGFVHDYVEPLVAEARSLRMGRDEVSSIINASFADTDHQ